MRTSLEYLRTATIAALVVFPFVVGNASPVLGEIFITSDTPANLGGTTWEPHEIVRDAAGTFSLERSLPPGTPLDATHRMNSGDWLVSVSEPTMLGAVYYDPRDIVRYDGSSFTLFFNGAAAGVPATANVDAFFLLGGDAGDLVISFDVPLSIGGTVYDPADLVRVSAGIFSLFFDASAASSPISRSTNLVEADERGGRLYLAFDIPITLGITTYLPGQIVMLRNSTFSPRFQISGWPAGGVMTGLALGDCLDGDGDRFGDPGDTGCPGGSGEDCDDLAAAVHPGAPQVCGDGRNNDCADSSWPAATGTNEADDDGDTLSECAGDCDDGDAGTITAPVVVTGLLADLIPGGARYTWAGQPSAGSATVYDVFWGSVGMLIPAGDFVSGMCRAEDLTTAVFEDMGRYPSPGDTYYFLTRAQNSCGTSSWGTLNRDVTASASPDHCH